MNSSAIKTNIITGFLGTGKTTAILNLLKQKPANERWAVLINEFGEIGIDGSLVHGTKVDNNQVYIREVAGGCMCCTAGLPMQIALNMLLARAKPHRLLIEPTGLGHPREVMQTLNAEHYKSTLHLCNTITLVDARKFSDSRYIEHATFLQQLEIADIIVANKADLYSEQDNIQLENFLEQTYSNKREHLHYSEYAQFSVALLDNKYSNSKLNSPNNSAPSAPYFNAEQQPSNTLLSSVKEYPESGFICVKNKGEGFVSQGWQFNSDFIFNKKTLDELLLCLSLTRLKGVFKTDEGDYAYNIADDIVSETKLNHIEDSRIEFISEQQHVPQNFEQAILNCALQSNSQH